VAPSLRLSALTIAQSYLGVHEVGGNNRGPEVEEMLRLVKLPPGEPWCEAALYTFFAKAAGALGLVNPVPRTGSTLRMWALAEPVCRDSNPVAGAIYVLKHSEHTGHVGIIESVNDDGTITEISGNTFADKGGRAGNCVARHTGRSPEAIHGGELQGYLNFDRAAQAPPGFTA
jgi:hypothetical protein